MKALIRQTHAKIGALCNQGILLEKTLLHKTRRTFTVATLSLAVTFSAQASVVTTYNDASTFNTDIIGLDTTVCDFESISAGDVVGDGDSLCGMTFDYDLAGLDLTVNNEFDTTSGTNYLGVDGGDFWLGDSFDLTFDENINAFGISIITSLADIFADDITIEISDGFTTNTLAVQETLTDGGSVLFLGIHDIDGFNSVSFSTFTGCTGCVLFGIDDITYASATTVPEPSSSALFALGLLTFGIGRKLKLKKSHAR
jgi:hypothetical protein